jgi:hypothetical protein
MATATLSRSTTGKVHHATALALPDPLQNLFKPDAPGPLDSPFGSAQDRIGGLSLESLRHSNASLRMVSSQTLWRGRLRPVRL